MTQQHPITPPPELFKQWFKQWEDDILNERDSVDHVLDRAWRNGFQAGADQELEACCEWLETGPYDFSIEATAPSMTKRLRAARRPKPSSLAEQASQHLDEAVMRGDCITTTDAMPYLRQAIKRLAELEQQATPLDTRTNESHKS